jgi:hypothetical protein
MVPTDLDAGDQGGARADHDMGTVAQDGVLLFGVSLIITVLGMHLFYRVKGKPVNSSVAGLVTGIGTGVLVSLLWWGVTGSTPRGSIQLNNKARFPCTRI